MLSLLPSRDGWFNAHEGLVQCSRRKFRSSGSGSNERIPDSTVYECATIAYRAKRARIIARCSSAVVSNLRTDPSWPGGGNQKETGRPFGPEDFSSARSCCHTASPVPKMIAPYSGVPRPERSARLGPSLYPALRATSSGTNSGPGFTIAAAQLIQLHKSLHFSPLSAILIASGRCTLGLSPPSGRATGKGTLA